MLSEMGHGAAAPVVSLLPFASAAYENTRQIARLDQYLGVGAKDVVEAHERPAPRGAVPEAPDAVQQLEVQVFHGPGHHLANTNFVLQLQ